MSLDRQNRFVRIVSSGLAFSTVCLMAALGMLGCSSTEMKSMIPGDQKADRIVVVKSKHTMTLMAKDRVA